MIPSLKRVGPDTGLSMPLLLLLFLSLLAHPVASYGQGLTFTASPSARWVEWDEDLNFRQSRLWGGAVGMGFGRYVGLQAFYHQGDKLKLLKPGEGEETPQLFDLANSGARVSLALGSGTFVPVLVGGGSLMAFQPKDGDEIKKLSLDYGGGFRVVLAESLHGEIIVEANQFRLDPVLVATGAPGVDGVGPLRRNLTLRASLGIQLGRRSFDKASDLDNAFAQRYQAPFSNFALAIEPLIGRLDYDKAIDLDNQEMVGLRAGVDFGSFFGLRGFHWWGTESDFRSTTDFRAYGGEAQFNLAGGPGLNPYLVGGAGELSWGDAEEGEAGRPRDQTALILGGGVDFNFGSYIRGTVSARDFILSGSDLAASPDLNTISDPDELVHNWQFSAGLKFLVGRRGIRSGRPQEDSREAWQAEAEKERERELDLERELARAEEQEAQAQAQAQVQAQAQAGAPQAQTTDTLAATEALGVLPDTLAAVAPIVPGQTIILPVLEQGEIYIRFGEPGTSPLVTTIRTQGGVAPAEAAPTEAAPTAVAPAGVAGAQPATAQAPTLEDIRRLIQEELAKQQPRQAQDPDALRALEDRLLRRLDEIEAARRRSERTTPVTPAAPAAQAAPAPARTEAGSEPMDRSVREIRPYSGFNLSNDFQVLLGVGVDIGPVKSGSRFNLVPQLAFGFGDGPTSFLLSADVEYRFPTADVGSRVTLEPLISAGPGLIRRDRTELQLGVFLGTGVQLYRRNGAPHLHLFGGIQGIDFFEDARFIVGLRRSR